MKEFFAKIKEKLNPFWQKVKKFLPSKRRLIQLYAALLHNANLKGFKTGVIYQGPVKNICTPGLNCYSCPGASGACPLGALQNGIAASGKTAPYYVFGIIILYGFLFGRWICGWLCPFGLFQDLLYKIKTPKLIKSKFTRALSILKYVILVLFVVVIPLIYSFWDFPLPAFCKYICPAGTLGGAILSLLTPARDNMLPMLSVLFNWKFCLAVGFVVASIFIYRFFCRFFCPLGALYGLFNKISLVGVKVDKPKCIDCGRCVSHCKMDIKCVGDRECINCGECISVCPTNAIRYKGSKIILPDSEIKKAESLDKLALQNACSCTDEVPTLPTIENTVTAKDLALTPLTNVERVQKRRRTRVTVLQIVSVVLMLALLTGALVYYNAIDEIPTIDLPTDNENPDNGNQGGNTDGGNGGNGGNVDDGNQGGEDQKPAPVLGNKVGNLCYNYDLRPVFGTDVININDYRGKVVVVNFWGTWCGPCKEELPEFNQFASDYADKAVVIAIHSSYQQNTAESYINEHFPDSNMIFALDDPINAGSNVDIYFSMLGGTTAYPITIILDENGVILHWQMGKLSYEKLVEYSKVNE